MGRKTEQSGLLPVLRARCIDCGAPLHDEPTHRCDACAHRHDMAEDAANEPDDPPISEPPHWQYDDYAPELHDDYIADEAPD